jgi:NADH:ubiquinone oxidoreductase subunit F (NADH-binding)
MHERLDALRRRTGALPAAAREGVRTFYDQLRDPTPGPRVCIGTACAFPGGGSADEGSGIEVPGAVGTVRCLGYCHAAPAVQLGDRVSARRRDTPRRALTTPVVLRNLLSASPVHPSEHYLLPDGDTVLARLDDAGLRGRGGASYPTAAKWRAARDAPGARKFVVANGDEGDPGSFVDRVLLEEDPHAVLAGVSACARVVGAREAVVFVRGEYPRAEASVHAAVSEATARGWLDGLDVRVVRGAGSYVCGEETALLRAIEGLRGEPSPRPPYPTEHGLHECPTVVQNVETLSLVPWVARHGRRPDTKVASVSGAVRAPGLVEFALGTPLRALLGEPPEGRRWRMALVGGPLGRVLPAERFDQALSFDALPGLGHAGIVVLDDTVTPRALAEHLYAFAAGESCGACTPCRIGTGQLSRASDRGTLERLLDTLSIGSLCGFGLGVPRPLRDLLALWPDEVFA